MATSDLYRSCCCNDDCSICGVPRYSVSDFSDTLDMSATCGEAPTDCIWEGTLTYSLPSAVTVEAVVGESCAYKGCSDWTTIGSLTICDGFEDPGYYESIRCRLCVTLNGAYVAPSSYWTVRAWVEVQHKQIGDGLPDTWVSCCSGGYPTFVDGTSEFVCGSLFIPYGEWELDAINGASCPTPATAFDQVEDGSPAVDTAVGCVSCLLYGGAFSWPSTVQVSRA